MRARREEWSYENAAHVQVRRYRNAHNVPHWHYDCELVFVENGALEIVCDDKAYTVSRGQVFFIDSKQVHMMNAVDTDTVDGIIVFDYEILHRFAGNKMLACPLLSRDYGVIEFAAKLKKILKENLPYCEFETADLVGLKLLEIFRAEPLTVRVEEKNNAERIRDLFEDIDADHEFYTLDRAADFMGMNAAYFSRFFHKSTGMTFSHYLNYVKTEKAVEMIKTKNGLSMTEVATLCGFSTIRNFNRIFKEFTGYTPKSLPKDYSLPKKVVVLSEARENPTLAPSVLLESE